MEHIVNKIAQWMAFVVSQDYDKSDAEYACEYIVNYSVRFSNIYGFDCIKVADCLLSISAKWIDDGNDIDFVIKSLPGDLHELKTILSKDKSLTQKQIETVFDYLSKTIH